MMITLLSSLFSGILATCITLIVTNILRKREEDRNFKLQIFKDIIAYRTDITTGFFSSGNLQKAISQIFIAYNDCPDVLKAFEEFRKSTLYRKDSKNDGDKIIDNFLLLLKAMAKELHIDYSFSNDDLFTKPLIMGAPMSTTTFTKNR